MTLPTINVRFSPNGNLNIPYADDLPNIPRSEYPDNWSQSLKDDYAKKANYIEGLHQHIDLLRDEIRKTQAALNTLLTQLNNTNTGG